MESDAKSRQLVSELNWFVGHAAGIREFVIMGLNPHAHIYILSSSSSEKKKTKKKKKHQKNKKKTKKTQTTPTKTQKPPKSPVHFFTL